MDRGNISLTQAEIIATTTMSGVPQILSEQAHAGCESELIKAAEAAHHQRPTPPRRPDTARDVP